MKIYEIRCKVYLLRDIYLNNLRDKIEKFMDKMFAICEETLEYHNERRYKEYCFGVLTPIEHEGVYKENKIYTFIIRTSNKNLSTFFMKNVPNNYTNEIRGLKCEINLIENICIESIYSLTPIIIKNDSGYWKNNMSVYTYVSRIENNLFKKYKSFVNKDFKEDFRPFADFTFINRTPIGCRYKTKTLLGDKVKIDFFNNPSSQEIAYSAIASGIGEMNSRGFGFVGYKINKP